MKDVVTFRDPIVKVRWKDEGDFGPIALLTQADIDNPPGPRPFDPDRPLPQWYSRAQAQAIADDLGAEFEEL